MPPDPAFNSTSDHRTLYMLYRQQQRINIQIDEKKRGEFDRR